uniref:UBC core domain-containing protein n=1 Tax=Panagrolaimus superbus TaxID=310955 RepID=A0A914XUX1_9BILA
MSEAGAPQASPPPPSSPTRPTASSQSPTQLKVVSMKRIMREIEHFKMEPPFYLVNFTVDSKDIRKWIIHIKPRYYPYKYGVFKVKIDLHHEYPFKPPRMQFLTPIYHPNFDEKGRFCLSILQMDNWKAGTTVATALDSLLHLLESPEAERSLRVEIGDQFSYQKSVFMKTAAMKAKKDSAKINNIALYL